jgi:phosphoenolpyruvate synthase/pyruvate phosphate dikinase
MSEEMVLPLSEAADVRLVGGKAASLSRLMAAGFNMPDGFVITTLADIGNLDAALGEFDKLQSKKVAVRSSAAAEDGTKDAWAGQLDTFLNVERAELLDKIRACFESAQSDRARAYAKQKNINMGKVAVIVQKMVPAQVSGVAFSVHPVTNDHCQMVVESASGLGEKMVSGEVTPDTCVVDKQSGDVVEKHLAGARQILSNVQLKEISETIVKIEALFGFPVDVEWAISNEQLFILQSRPITTLG